MIYDSWKLATPPEYDEPCIRDDSTECDCPRCSAAEDRFWREQGEDDDGDECPHCDFGCSSCSPLVTSPPLRDEDGG